MIEAAAKIKEGIAYTGGFLSLPGWNLPVVVEIAGMEILGETPLLVDHDNKTRSRLGVVAVSVAGDSVYFSGDITAETAEATNIVSQKKPWQTSIGAEVLQFDKVVEGSRRVNGQTFSAPFYHVKKSRLREISVVPVGADYQTKMVVASQNLYLIGGIDLADEKKDPVQASPPPLPVPETNSGGDTPPTIEKKEKIVEGERERISGIIRACGEYHDIRDKAITAGWSFEKTCAEVLSKLRDDRPKSIPAAVVAHNLPDGEEVKKTVEASMCLRLGISGDALVKQYGEKIVDRADKDRISIPEMMQACCKLEGKPFPEHVGDGVALIRAAFSTISVPGILGNVANKVLMKAYQDYPIVALRLCQQADLNDFKESERYRLTDGGDLTQVAPDGMIKDGTFSEWKSTNQLATYGKKFALTRQMIINDDLGAFAKIPAMFGARAARKIDQLFFTRLLSNPTMEDSVALFNAATHLNYDTGADTALSATSLQQAIQMFMDAVDDDSQPINIAPKFLLVPTPLKWTALELTKSQSFITTGGDTMGGAVTTIPAMNSLSMEGLEVISSPYLNNTTYSGYSSVAWYLWGDPSVCDTFEVGFLKGKRSPTVEQGELDYNYLGIWFRVYFDLGVREQDYRSMVKMKGEA